MKKSPIAIAATALLILIALSLSGCGIGYEAAIATPIMERTLPTDAPTLSPVPPTEVPPTATPTATPAPMPTEPPAPLTVEVLRNGVYPNEISPSGSITLTDGAYEGEPYVPDSASRPQASLIEPIALGDLDGDGVDDAALIIAADGGGSGVFLSLEVLRNVEGQPVHAHSAALGDRPQILSLTIKDGVIHLVAVTHGPDDAMCCPTQIVRSAFTLEAGALVESEWKVIGQVGEEEQALAEMIGKTWVWLEYIGNGDDDGIYVDDPTRYTLSFAEDGQAQFQIDCNRGNAEYTIEGKHLSFGPIAATRAACGPDSYDTAYIQYLSQVVSYFLRDGRLYLSLEGNTGGMIFEGIALPEEETSSTG